MGPSVVWWVLPKGRNASQIYEKIISGDLGEKEYSRYYNEIHRLFEKRKNSINPEMDASLSFTTSMGFNPNGVSLPGWKAVFFNPKTDESVIRQIIKSIEEL
jgi:hypothetical protein